MLTKKDKNVATADAIRLEAQGRIRSIALPIMPGENVKAQWRKISRKTGLSCRRVRTLWYGQAETIHAQELETIRAFSAATEEVERAVVNVADLQSSIVELMARVSDLAAKIDSLGKNNDGQGLWVAAEKTNRSVGRTSPVG